jgi:hypothetical protein
MSSLALPADAVARVPLVFVDQFKRPAALTTALLTAASLAFDSTVFSAVLAADGLSVTVTPVVTTGSGTVTYTNGPLTASLSVEISAPVVTSVDFDAADATFTPTPVPEAAAATGATS